MNNQLEFFDARPLYEWLSLTDEMSASEGSEAIFILGANSDAPIKRAVEIAKEHETLPIFFCSLGSYYGGNVLFGVTEKTYYQKILTENGIAKERIYCPEDNNGSTNTLEEALLGMEIISEQIGHVPEKVVLISRPVHQRRAWATFIKHFPTTEFVNMPAIEPLTYELLPRIVGEYKRLIEYAKQDSLADVAVPPELLTQVEQLNGLLPASQQEELTWL